MRKRKRKPTKSRLASWEEPLLFQPFLSSSEEVPENDAFVLGVWAKQPAKLTDLGFIEQCRELIYDEVDGEPVFHAIVISLNAPRLEIQASHMADILTTGTTPEERSDSIRTTLAHAFVSEIPVYPNTEALAAALTSHTRDLFLAGFTAPDGTGKRVKLRLVDAPGAEVDTVEYLRNRSTVRHLGPNEMLLIRDTALREIARRDEATRVLAQLELAIDEFGAALAAHRANESQLQECLQRNPILFGPHYRRVLPKHRLGSEYEMDFALERVDGMFDLVEIEASTHSLFTRRGDPTKALVHAEQQALDWLDWVERNSAYARERLPGLIEPTAFVVIGRSGTLDKGCLRRLTRRNVLFRDRVRILTYDDLLEASRNLLSRLRGDA